MNTEKTFTLAEVKAILAHQLKAEKQNGANERDYNLIRDIFSDVEYLLEKGFIVNGIKF
jgi:hypothetical protein